MIAVIMSISLVIAGAGAFILLKDTAADLTVAVGTKDCYEPWWIADELGYFRDAGVKIDIISVSGGGKATEAILAGRADIASAGTDPLIKVLNEGRGKYNLIGTYQNGESFLRMAAWNYDDDPSSTNTTADLEDPETLIGKVIGLDVTTGYYSAIIKYMNLNACTYEEITDVSQRKSDRVNIMHVPFNAQVPRLIGVGSVTQDIDAIIGGSYNLQAEYLAGNFSGGAPKVIISEEDGGTDQNFQSVPVFILATENAINNKGDAVMRMMEALQRACAFIYGVDEIDINDISSYTINDDACKLMADTGIFGLGWTKEIQKRSFEYSTWGLDFKVNDLNALKYSYDVIRKNSADRSTYRNVTDAEFFQFYDQRFMIALSEKGIINGYVPLVESAALGMNVSFTVDGDTAEDWSGISNDDLGNAVSFNTITSMVTGTLSEQGTPLWGTFDHHYLVFSLDGVEEGDDVRIAGMLDGRTTMTKYIVTAAEITDGKMVFIWGIEENENLVITVFRPGCLGYANTIYLNLVLSS